MRLAGAALFAATLALLATGSFAAPPAGTVIGNQATATYNDSAGTSRTATSNLVQTTVTQVKSFTLTANGARTAAPGQTIYYPHTLTNTGNGTDTYTLNAPASSSFGAAGPHLSMVYFVDANGDGIPDNATPVTTTGALPAGGVFRFVVAGTVPAGAPSASTATITVSASDTTPTTTTNTDTTTVADSVITVTKSLSAASGPSPAGPITVTLAYSNTGSAAATNVQLTDILPPTLTYVANSGRWSVSGAANALTDANDGVEQPGFPPGIDFRSTLGAGATVTAIVPSVAAGASGNVTFQVNVNGNLAPQVINNTAQFQTATQGSANTNTASYQVLQTAGVVANGSATLSTNGTAEPVSVASAPAGSTFTFSDEVWNRGNGTDTFDITVAANSFPAGTTITLLQQDGSTALLNSAGSAAPDTGPMPGTGQACPAPLVTDTTSSPTACGYRVVVRVTLPPTTPPGSYSLTLRATSVFNPAISDDVIDTLSAVVANTVDVTNDRAAPPAGTAAASDGLAASGTAVMRTNAIALVSGGPTVTRFRAFTTNTGLVSDSFNLAATFSATSAAGVVPPALPAGWSVAIRADGGANDCSTVGAVIGSTGPLAAGAARLACVEVTAPAVGTAGAIPGNYDFDIAATSATNAAVTDSVRDRVTILPVRSFTLAPNGSQQVFAGNSVVYTHILTNTGNAVDTINFAAGCLADSRGAQGWTSSAFVDANANGVFDAGTDTPVACGAASVTLNPGEARSIFVRATAPASALATDPANVTTITATYSATISATDTTAVVDGLSVLKEQQALGTVGCANASPPGGAYTTSPLPPGGSTAPGACIAYRVTAINITAAAMTGVTISDVVPAGTRMAYGCSGNGIAAPSTSVGAIAPSTPANGASGTVTANVGVLAAGQSAALTFCVQLDPLLAVGSTITNRGASSGQQGAATSNAQSNIVTAAVGAPVSGRVGAAIVTDWQVNSAAGVAVFLRHTLRNYGSVTDTFTLAPTDLNLGFSFVSILLYADANQDGVPDSTTPISGPITLAPFEEFHFVARLHVPAGVPQGTDGAARIDATSLVGATVLGVNDRVHIFTASPPCQMVDKSLSASRGPSPAGPITVTLHFRTCDKPLSRLVISDLLPASMRYVAGSARSTFTGTTTLTDAIVGNDRQGTGAVQVGYDFNQTAPGTATATIYSLPADADGAVTFQVEIIPGLNVGTLVPNNASYVFYDPAGNFMGGGTTDTVSYTVDSRVDLRLAGQRIASAAPGATTTFTNVLTNLGDATDTFDITLSANTFPAGTTVALFKADGVTPLADTDGDGIPDSGPLPPGASVNIVVKVTIPETAPPGAYKVTKTARSARAPVRSASADDSVDTIAARCVLVLDPDNQALIGRGQHIVYTHFLTNHGNCRETVTARLDFLGDSVPGWTSSAYIDNPVAGRGSIPGVVDATDTPIVMGWSHEIGPGESLRVLLDVRAPGVPADAKRANAKQTSPTNTTTLVITGLTVGALIVHDKTVFDDEDVPAQPTDVIRNFVDATYQSPSVWGVIGRSLFLRADAPSCNADPARVETRTVVITGPNGEREEVTATETGANSGVFVVPALPVRLPPVVAGDNVLEGNANDSFDIQLLGCGQHIAAVVTLMDPSSVVFDSRTNEPIANAVVTLVGASGGQCTTIPATFSGTNVQNPVTTGTDGRFAFPAVAGDYCLSVKAPNGYRFPSRVEWPLQPRGHNLDVTGLTAGGSYGNPFHVTSAGVVVDVPLDPAAQDGLFVQKDASRQFAEIGDFVDYSVQVNNGTGNALDRANATLVDNLPAGFAYVPGSARRDKSPMADPAGGKGPQLTFTLGHLDRGAQTTITYRVRIGPGAAQGDGTNRVQAAYAFGGANTLSNIAAATVKITGGVFTDKGFILGKIFADCNANGVQDAGEPGVPAVRIFLEDGTYVITDGGGKFSFYGISNRTHVVKVDRTTLPALAHLAAISARHLGDGGSRIVDLKAGELARADFAIDSCEGGLREEIGKRAADFAKRDELGAMATSQLATEARVIVDPRTLPATGVVEATPTTAAANALPAQKQEAPGLAAAKGAANGNGNGNGNGNAAAQTAAAKPIDFETALAGANDTVGFVGMEEGAEIAGSQATIRVKGKEGADFALSVNGKPVSTALVGKRVVLNDAHVQGWEFFGVPLQPGENTLTLAQRDGFGNDRGEASLHVRAPGRPVRILVEAPAQGGIADGRSGVAIVVKLVDENKLPVSGRIPVTLEATRGAWDAKDLDPREDGTQVMVENGVGEFTLRAPIEPGESRIVVAGAGLRGEGKVDFLPELRNMVAAGVVEGIINVRRLDTRALVPARAQDNFEQELTHLSRTSGDGLRSAGARAAFFLKGKIRGDYLLTAAYDSDKDTRERLFRDIQPDEFYPVYGDSAIRGYDAQSTGRLYVRIDRQKSYLLYGDFTTQGDTNVRRLSTYSRSLTGVKEHYDNGRVAANVFASRDSTRQKIDEFRANGTSGPYFLSTANGLVNSEKVEILIRDRNRPALVLQARPQARFFDYEMEPLTGRILFKSPVPSVDENINPIFIRVTYEVDQGGDLFWVYGADAQVKVTERIEVGANFAEDHNPAAPFRLRGANGTVRLGEHTTATVEFARTEHPDTGLNGNGERIHVRHDGDKLKAEAFVARTDPTFDNPGAYLTQGRGESGARATYKLDENLTLKAEALRTEDTLNHNTRDGFMVSAERSFDNRMKLELGLRHAHETGGLAVPPVCPDPSQPCPGPAATDASGGATNDVTSVRAKVSGPVPMLPQATAYGEVEVDTQDTNRKVVAVGGDYVMPNKGKIYFRHEFISSLTGPYGLANQQRQNATVLGIDTEYMKDARLFSEYRIRDALDGGTSEAAIGLRNLWPIAEGLRVGTSIERVHALSGASQNENTAVALAVEYTANPLWKGSSRIEVRDATSQQSLLHTVGFASRVSQDWTFLARNALSIQRNKGGELDGAEHRIERLQAGVAYRDNATNKWNALARVEHKDERDNTQSALDLKRTVELVSLHADWQPRRPFLVTGHYAAKWSNETSNGIATRYRAQLASARFTWEFAPKWDFGLAAGGLFGEQASSRQYGVGVEVGYLVMTNLWLSAGYNVFGYHDDDLTAGEYTNKGAYVRLRYKFDETTLGMGAEAPAAGRSP